VALPFSGDWVNSIGLPSASASIGRVFRISAAPLSLRDSFPHWKRVLNFQCPLRNIVSRLISPHLSLNEFRQNFHFTSPPLPLHPDLPPIPPGGFCLRSLKFRPSTLLSTKIGLLLLTCLVIRIKTVLLFHSRVPCLKRLDFLTERISQYWLYTDRMNSPGPFPSVSPIPPLSSCKNSLLPSSTAFAYSGPSWYKVLRPPFLQLFRCPHHPPCDFFSPGLPPAELVHSRHRDCPSFSF